jgi:hypothetical protein
VIVMLDAAIVLPSAARAGLVQLMKDLHGPNYRAVARDYVADVFSFRPMTPGARRASLKLRFRRRAT